MHFAPGTGMDNQAVWQWLFSAVPALSCVPAHLLPSNLLVHASPLTSATKEKNKEISVRPHITVYQSPPTVSTSLHHPRCSSQTLSSGQRCSPLYDPCGSVIKTQDPPVWNSQYLPPKDFTAGHPVTGLCRFKDCQVAQEGFLLMKSCLPQSGGYVGTPSLVLCW